MVFNNQVRTGDLWCVESGSLCHMFFCGDVGRQAIPKFMERVQQDIDAVYTDPPWNDSVMTMFAKMAGTTQAMRWDKLMSIMLQGIRQEEIDDLWIEMGVPGSRYIINQMHGCHPAYDTHWNVMYAQEKHNVLIHFGKPVEGSANGLNGRQVPLFAFAHMSDVKVVLDPFIGKGTTAKITHQQGKTCYGIELVPSRLDKTLEWFANQKESNVYRLGQII